MKNLICDNCGENSNSNRECIVEGKDKMLLCEKCIKRYCPKCDSKLEVEKEIDYPYVCKGCDENFYEFETKTK